MRWANLILEVSLIDSRQQDQCTYKSLDSASLQDSMEAYDSVKAMVGSEDFVEGPKAFSEKETTQLWK